MGGTREAADVVVVGMGASAGIAVGPLTQAGLRVVALEAGPRRDRDDYRFDEIDNDLRNWLGDAKANGEIPTLRQSEHDEAGPPPVASPMINAVGGTALHSTSQYFRLLPWHFRERSATIERYGADAIPEGTAIADWPYGYEELEPYYTKVDEFLGVSGKAGNVAGELDDAGNVFEGPRGREYPLPPLRRTGYTKLMAETARELGWHPFPGAAGIRSRPYAGLPACTYCGFCTFNGCWTDAKGVTSLRGIPEAEDTGNLEIVTGARVIRIDTRADGRATGVTFLEDGEEVFQPASLVILSAFSFENVRLLLLSRGDAHPRGVGNDRGQVGRYLMAHHIMSPHAVFPGRDLNAMTGTAAQATFVDDWEGDNFDHSALGFLGGSTMGMQMEIKPIAAARGIPPEHPRWGTGWKKFLSENGRSIGEGLLQIEQLPYVDHRLDLDPKHKDSLGMPVVRSTISHKEPDRRAYEFLAEKVTQWFRAAGATDVFIPPMLLLSVSAHVYGGTRMGEDPATSVVDEWSLVHDAPNVAVLGISTMPCTAGRNPTLTVQAMAWRTAERIAQRWDEIAS
jgi:gluconate 2-dehydrogenase alpha chain